MTICTFPKVEFTAEENKPNVILDGCKAKRAESKTVFEVVFIFAKTPLTLLTLVANICVKKLILLMQVRTEKLGELPLVDFYPVDYGQQQQAFGFEVIFIILYQQC